MDLLKPPLGTHKNNINFKINKKLDKVFGFIADASQSIPYGRTKSMIPWKSTPAYGKSSMTIN
jgi:hypothetical protein